MKNGHLVLVLETLLEHAIEVNLLVKCLDNVVGLPKLQALVNE